MSKIRTILGGIVVGFVCATTPRCREMTRLISMERDAPVGAITAFRMRMHYKVCVWCERYRDQVALISELSKEFPEADHGAPSLTEEARERIADALKKEIS
jgi:hypothetical protein